MTQPATLIIDHVSRRFGGLCALNDFALTVRTGELVGLIGPNGAGKTTAFNVITGVYPPSAGAIRLGDRRIDARPPAEICRAGIARTFQNIRLFKSLSVLDNVTVAFARAAELGLPRTLLRAPAFFRAHRAATDDGVALLRTLGLADKAHLPAG